MADFIAKLTPLPSSEEKSLNKWILNVDGSLNEKGSGAGILLQAPNGNRFEYAVRFCFPASNNEVEYKALVVGLRMAEAMGATHLDIRSYSQLVVNQITKEYQAKDSRMERYLHKVRELLSRSLRHTIERVSRAENAKADALAKLTSSYPTELYRSIPIEILEAPSIQEPEAMIVEAAIPTWMDYIKAFLRGEELPEQVDLKKMRCKATWYVLRGDVLYKRGFSLLLLRYVDPEEANYVLREVHEGVCGKLVKQGYY